MMNVFKEIHNLFSYWLSIHITTTDPPTGYAIQYSIKCSCLFPSWFFPSFYYFFTGSVSTPSDSVQKLIPVWSFPQELQSFCVPKHLIHTSIATHIFYTIAYLWKSVAKYYSSLYSQDLNQCLAPTRITLYVCWVSRLTSDSELIQAWIPKNNI